MYVNYFIHNNNTNHLAIPRNFRLIKRFYVADMCLLYTSGKLYYIISMLIVVTKSLQCCITVTAPYKHL